MLLKDKVSIVTGAAAGIGAGIAELFAEHGSTVYLIDLDGDGCERVAARINAAGGTAYAHTGDVSRVDSVIGATQTAASRHGRIDILINNAGIYPRRPFLEMEEAEWDQMQDVNLKSVFHLCKLVVPHMIAQRSGKIVNLSSVTFFKGLANLCHYVASKGGMIGFSRSLARELGPHNVHINCITPGAVKTEGEIIHAQPDMLADIQRCQCLDRRLLPVDVARVVLFLASEMSDGMTGQTLNVDGGLILY
ncbi:MAG: SDR family oxidoreductase [Acidobacteria bacterium]|nr:SDR family oxidoreductase [Acidobacteriota bacterium]